MKPSIAKDLSGIFRGLHIIATQYNNLPVQRSLATTRRLDDTQRNQINRAKMEDEIQESEKKDEERLVREAMESMRAEQEVEK